MVELIKTSKNRADLSGNFTYWTEKTEYVEVNGKTYCNTERDQITKKIDELKKEGYVFNPTKWVFHEIDYEFEIYDSCPSFGKCISVQNGRIYSSLNDVHNLISAYHLGYLDNRIKGLYTTSKNNSRNINNEFKYIVSNLIVTIEMCSLGYNNGLFYELSLKDFLNIPPQKMPPRLKLIFKKGCGLDLDKRDVQPKDLIKMLKTQIQYA